MIQANESENQPPLALLAEDDDMIRELVSLYLERLGYEVVSCKNGQEAVDALELYPKFDLVVTDLVMPELGGAEVVKTTQSLDKCKRILIISGFSDDLKFLEQAIESGNEFLKKPFTFSGFTEKIENLKKRYT